MPGPAALCDRPRLPQPGCPQDVPIKGILFTAAVDDAAATRADHLARKLENPRRKQITATHAQFPGLSAKDRTRKDVRFR
jgi:hypothetical protein